MTLFHYVLGPQPYGNGDFIEDWGQRKGRFSDLESALRSILMGHPHPVVLVGRYAGLFVPGVSISGAHAYEVIQVWSTEPQALQNIEAYDKQFPEAQPDHWPHTGDGTHVGLLAEIHVRSIEKYLTPVIAGYLTDGTDQAASASPAGRFALSFTPRNRNALQVRLLQGRLAGIGTSIKVRDGMMEIKEKMGQFREGMAMMNAYCNGTHGLMKLAHGDRAPAGDPYSIFQSRVYLEEELGLIANLVEMDHRDMASIDAWIMSSERWKKLLPLPKCILVTRICRERRQYNNMSGMEEAFHNHFNMESLIWVRDGGNVWRFATDIHFEERVFLAGDDPAQLIRRAQEAVWKRHWGGGRQEADARWARDRNVPVPEKIDPATVEEPVPVAWKDETVYATLENFLESEHYTPELDLNLRHQVSEGLRSNQREKMPFALLLQGIIDHKGILSIPPGTDIFDPVEQQRFIRLVNDFSHGLVDKLYSDQFDRFTQLDALKPGTRILGWRWDIYSEKWDHAAKWNHGKQGDGPFVFTVHHVEPETERSSEWICGRLFVHEFALNRRWVGKSSALTKQLASADIHTTHWLPVDIPVGLAEKLLDDRSWKRDHKWAVPLLAQWKEIRAQIPPVATDARPLAIQLERKGRP